METDKTTTISNNTKKKRCCNNLIKTKFFKYLLVFTLASSIGLFFRLFPLLNYSPGDFREKATLLVIHQLRETVKNNVEANHSGLSLQEKNLLVRTQFNKLLNKEKLKVRNSIKSVSKNFADQSLQKRRSPYLLASDSFYYYGLTKNIERYGKISDTIKGSKYLNPLMLAPNGHYEPLTLHPYIGFSIYKVMKLFNPSTDLMHAVSYTPLVIATFSVIPFLIICYSFGISTLCSFVGAVFFLLAPIFIKRSTFGWYDNDPYNTLFPLLVLSIIFLGLSKISIKKNLLYGLMSAFLLMLYAFFWQGWVLMFFVIFSSGIVITLHNHFILKNKSEAKNSFSYFGIFSIASFLSVSIAFGPGEFLVLFKEGWIALKNFLTPQLSLWPDLYISVSELHSATLSYIIEYSGGKFFIAIAILGFIVSLLTLPKRKNIENIPKIIIITVFLSISLIISSGAQRFVMLVFVPISIFFAIGIDYIYKFCRKLINSGKSENKNSIAINPKQLILNIALTITILSTVLIPINSINNTIESLLNPIFNEVWETSLLQIKEKTPKNSIITTWWPPGHFIKSIAERSVTFDGATINVPQAYWVSNIFLSQNETQALGLIRMLNNSGNKASDFLVKERGFKLSTSIALLKLITGLPPIKAAIALSTVFNDANSINQLLELTHKTPPPSYILIYNEFVENNLQLKFIGKWNFAELEKINKDPELIKKVPNRNSDQYVQFLWELVGGAYKYSGILNQVDANHSRVIFDENITINLKTKECDIRSNTYGKGTPLSIIYLENNELKEKLIKNPTLSYSVLLLKSRDDTYNCILLDRPLAKSLLVHLYFFEGKGLKYFKPFIKETDLTGRTKISVYEVDWRRYSKETQIKYKQE